MKKIYLMSIAALAGVLLFAGVNRKPALPYGFANGTPEVKSIAALTFGPNGVLFIGDAQNASVIAFDTKDTQRPATIKAFDLPNIDEKIAAALGTSKENITITDMAVNPVSKKLYVAVKSADGTPVLLSIGADNQIKAVSLKDINFSTVTLN